MTIFGPGVTVDQIDADLAWEHYTRTGVIVPDFAGEIAERRRVQRRWAGDGVELR